MNDGTYKASAQGYDRDINIELEIADGKISDVSLLDNQETDAVIESAFPIIKERIVEANSPDVDCVSVKRILNLILSKGARLAEKGEFTKRGFFCSIS